MFLELCAVALIMGLLMGVYASPRWRPPDLGTRRSMEEVTE